MKNIFLIGLFLISSKLSAMEFILTEVQNTLRLYLLNSSQNEILLNKRFALGPSAGLNEIAFVFVDEHGKEFPFSAKIRLSAATEHDIVSLGPDMFIGKAFRKDELSRYYDLVPGQYSVTVLYRTSSGDVIGPLESNTLTIDIVE